MFTCVPSFNLLDLTVPEKRVRRNFNIWKLRERKMNTAAAWFRYTRYNCPLSTCVPSFNLLGLIVPEKSLTKDFNVWNLERKKNEEIQGRITSSSLIPVYTIHLPTVHMCTKFQPSRPHSSWEKCDEKFYYLKIERKKHESSSSLIPVYTIHLPTVHVCTKFQPSRPHSTWEKCDERY